MLPLPAQAEIIRAWLELQAKPRTCPQIAEAIGRPGDTNVHRNVHRMFRDGILSREGRCRSYAFAIAREARVQVRMPRDEQLRRNAEAERKRRARKGGRTLAQWRVERDARHQAWVERKAAEKAARKAKREAERASRPKVERKPRATKPKAPPKPRAPRVRVLKAAAPAPQQPRPVESVADFLRRGGKITRLEPHAVSHPLRITEELRAAA